MEKQELVEIEKVKEKQRQLRKNRESFFLDKVPVSYHVEVVFNLEQTDEGRHDLFDGKSGQGVLVAHDEDLAHLDDCLQLLALVPGCL